MTISRKYKNSNISVLKNLFDNTLNIQSASKSIAESGKEESYAQESYAQELATLTSQGRELGKKQVKGQGVKQAIAKRSKKIPLIDTSKLLTS